MQSVSTLNENQRFDLLVVGGGINGIGIAALAARRGLSVLVCEQGDIANATSSASSKLIHGGLRYLEHFELSMVRQSLKEREQLMKLAPHLVQAMRFRMPQKYKVRSMMILRAGLFLYDNLDFSARLPASTRIKFNEQDGLIAEIKDGFEYSDCWTDDARLVIANALAAKLDGAQILTRVRCEQLRPCSEGWRATLKDCNHSVSQTVTCRCVVNATGPWIGRFNESQFGSQGRYKIRLVKGSHIVVNRRYHNDKSYLLQVQDGRVVFVIPYLQDYSLIGTTDVEYDGELTTVCISEEETQYLLDVVNGYFDEPLQSDAIVSSFAGVRPLVEDKKQSASQVSREYKLSLDYPEKSSPILNVYGGKLTTYRVLAKQAISLLKKVFKVKKDYYKMRPLPGGEIPNFATFIEMQKERYRWLPDSLVTRYAYHYGTRMDDLIAAHDSVDSLGEHFGFGLYQHEVDFLVKEEWAQSAEDILFRRTKLGLHFDSDQTERLQIYLEGLETNVAFNFNA